MIAICTITDHSFERGCAALINSLVHHGFRGRFVIGLAGGGHTLPERLGAGNAYGLDVSFVQLPDRSNVNFHKPHIVSHCFRDLSIESVFFFDSDIVCCRDWRHFEEWLANGISVCSDVNYLWMPSNHPKRAYYRRALSEIGMPQREIVGYANGGFIGVNRSHVEVIEAWARLIDWFEAEASQSWDEWSLKAGFWHLDQDLLNAALMAVSCPISFVGHEGMSFNQAIGYMAHPIGRRKPWNRGFLKDVIVHGRGMPLTGRQYWNNVERPIKVTSDMERNLAKIEIGVAALLSRFIAR